MIKTIPVVSADATKATESKTSLNKDVNAVKVDKFSSLLNKQKQEQQDKNSTVKQEVKEEVKESVLDETATQDVSTQTNSQLELDNLLKSVTSTQTNTSLKNKAVDSKEVSENVSTDQEEKKSINIKISSTLDLDGQEDNEAIKNTSTIQSGQSQIVNKQTSQSIVATKSSTLTDTSQNIVKVNEQEVQLIGEDTSKEVTSQKKSAITVKKVENSIDSPTQAIVDMGQLALLTSDKFNNSMQVANGATFLSQGTDDQAINLTVSQGKELNQLANSILSGVKTLDKTDSSKITIQLTPKTLGKMEVSFHSDDKQVSLEFKVETTQTKQILESVSGKLQNILEKQGLNNLDSTTNNVKTNLNQVVGHLSETNSSSFDTQTMFDQSGTQRQFSQEQQGNLNNKNNKHDYTLQESSTVEQEKQESKISILA
ncbi:flagellar hook-length control protein FliK [Ligilactobacillus sp. WILCCON 0076]|uniref:Flagellar hook-length control protein FliK n=1 Tax=Ligilactobacillus ubinensis TaxID=2876789 RepID=A0A9X2FHM7_9LACO|nr:flagellar hook-length control protein FliK [Ligilactobacillus ubinensis]MCP0886247.1 flagellar hook-length control protein FliK [Ligilactobacillus ubinensis]